MSDRDLPATHRAALLASWRAAPDDPPAPDSDHAVTMEHRPGGRDGQELREVQTGAWLASTRVDRLTDAVDTAD